MHTCTYTHTVYDRTTTQTQTHKIIMHIHDHIYMYIFSMASDLTPSCGVHLVLVRTRHMEQSGAGSRDLPCLPCDVLQVIHCLGRWSHHRI